MKNIAFLVFFTAAIPIFAFGQTDGIPPRAVRFVIETSNGNGTYSRMVAATSNKIVISKARAQLSLPRAERALFISGNIAAGNGRVNQPWSWHFVPNRWDL